MTKSRTATMEEIEAAWFAKLAAITLQAIEDRATRLRSAGMSAEKIEDTLRIEAPELNNWLQARKADIRSILTSSAAGGVPVLADGTPATMTKIAAGTSRKSQ